MWFSNVISNKKVCPHGHSSIHEMLSKYVFKESEQSPDVAINKIYRPTLDVIFTVRENLDASK